MNHHARGLGAPQDAIYRRTDISPEDFFQSLGRVRRTVRDEIERLIEWLDATIDCDEDHAIDDVPCDEDADAGPALGSFDRMSNHRKAWQARFVTPDIDVEVDQCDDEHIGEDDEDGNDRELNVDDEDGNDDAPA